MKLLCLIASSFELYKFMAVLNPPKRPKKHLSGKWCFFLELKIRRNKKPGTAERFRLRGCSTGDWPESRFRKPEMTCK